MTKLHLSYKRTANRLNKFISSMSQYGKIDDNQLFRVYHDEEGDITAIEAVNFRLLWVNNNHSLKDISDNINNFVVLNFSSLKTLVYSFS